MDLNWDLWYREHSLRHDRQALITRNNNILTNPVRIHNQKNVDSEHQVQFVPAILENAIAERAILIKFAER